MTKIQLYCKQVNLLHQIGKLKPLGILENQTVARLQVNNLETFQL